MRALTYAMIWDVWNRSRAATFLLAGLAVVGLIVHFVAPESMQPDGVNARTGQLVLHWVYWHLMMISFFLVFSIFGYTEFNPAKSSTGFPHRLFTLPVTSLRLVAVPILLGTVAIEVIFWMWTGLIIEWKPTPVVGAVLFGTYMVVYQTVLWTLGRLGALRLIVLALIGMVFFSADIFLTFANSRLTESGLIAVSVALAILTFFISWMCISRQRAAGGIAWPAFATNDRLIEAAALLAPYMTYHLWTRGFSRPVWVGLAQLLILTLSVVALLRTVYDLISDRSPGRRKGFRSALHAQFWFEWRRSGLALPLLVGGLVCTVFAPLSWMQQSEPSFTLRILLWTVATPLILSLPVGKAFSKPDFWSGELSLPSVVAVKPLSNTQIVSSKMKVAVVSAALSWLMVIVFVAVWFALWANAQAVSFVRHALRPHYAIVILVAVSAVLLTWRFLVGSLWLGLSGHKIPFSVSVMSYPLLLVVGTMVVDWIFRRDASRWASIRHGFDTALPALVWIAVIAATAKVWMAIRTSRQIDRYFLPWLCGAVCLAMTAIGLSNLVKLPSYPWHLRILLACVGLLAMPIARISLASSSLSRNRHRV